MLVLLHITLLSCIWNLNAMTTPVTIKQNAAKAAADKTCTCNHTTRNTIKGPVHF